MITPTIYAEIKIRCNARTLKQQNDCPYFNCNNKIGSMQCSYKSNKAGCYCSNIKVKKAAAISFLD